jgi:hypothetical protein
VFPASSWHRRLARAVACCATGAIAGMAFAAPSHADTPVTTDHPRSSSGPVVHDDGAYEYAPTVLFENGKYRMWWCSQVPSTPVRGDDVLYAESDGPDGPFHAPGSSAPYVISFHGTGGEDFDGQHTCDPSVVKAGNAYYLFYGAAVHDGVTTIGVATSANGVDWTRLNGDRPIITPAGQQDTGNHYGAGQPSAVYLNGKFYLIFTDTTAAGADHSNGAGQFAWRSSDPTFQTGVDVYTGNGWQAKTDANSRSFSVANAFSADWQYSDALRSFIVAHNNAPGQTTLTFLDGTNLRNQPIAEQTIDGAWSEGPGIVSTPDKHALPGSACNRVPVDIVESADKSGGAPAHLYHRGVDLVFTSVSCQSPSPSPSHGSPSAPGSPTTSAGPSHAPSHAPSAQPSTTLAGGSGSGSGSLPVTGTNLALGAGIGAALLALGTGLFLAARRRRLQGNHRA